MCAWHRQFGVKVTHLPTGLSQIADCERNQHRNRVAATRALMAKLVAGQHLAPLQEVAVYELPEGEEYPHDLADYRKPRQIGERQSRDKEA